MTLCIILIAQSCKNNITKSDLSNFDKKTSVRSIQILETRLNPLSSINTLKGSFIDSDPIKDIYGGNMILEKTEFNSFYEKLKNNLSFDKVEGEITSFVIYMSDFSEEVLSSNIVGVSVFTIQSNNLKHQFFIKENQKYNEIKEFGGFIGSYSTFDFDVLLNYTLKKGNNYNSPAYVSFSPSTRNKISSNTETSLSSILIDSFVAIDIDPSSGCGSQCHNEDGGCTSDSEGEKMCDNCASSETEEVAEKNRISFDAEKNFPKAQAYDFRDNFLKKSTFGRKYINYYYKLSYFMKAKKLITRENFWKNISVGLKLYSIAKKIQYGDANHIVLNDDDASEILAMINFYKSKTSNASILSMLADIQKDVKTFTGKDSREAKLIFK